VKSSISTKQAAEHYGVKLNSGGFTRCPFHEDGVPSFKVYDDGFYCFGCHEHGDVIDFVSKLFGLDAREAAEKLAADFGISDSSFCQAKPVPPEKSDAEQNRKRLDQSWGVLCDYLHLLCDWRERYLPDREDEDWRSQFCEALQNTDRVEYLLDCIWDCPVSEAPALMEQVGAEIEHYRNRVEQQKGRDRNGNDHLQQERSADHAE